MPASPRSSEPGRAARFPRLDLRRIPQHIVQREANLTPFMQLSRASTRRGERYNHLTDALAIEGGCGNAAFNALPIDVEALP